MTIELSLKVTGLQAAMKLMQRMHGIPRAYRGVKLSDVERTESDAENSIIAEALQKSGRDFFSLRKGDEQHIVAAYDREIQIALDKEARLLAKLERSTAVGAAAKLATFKGAAEGRARGMAGKALRAAMAEYMRLVTQNIEQQRTKSGAPRELTEEYAAVKQRRWGFVHPIGKASGQLLENLNPTEAGRNISLIR